MYEYFTSCDIACSSKNVRLGGQVLWHNLFPFNYQMYYFIVYINVFSNAEKDEKEHSCVYRGWGRGYLEIQQSVK